MIDIADLAYMAGLLDGEGGISIKRADQYYNPHWSPRHWLLITVSNTHEGVVRWCEQVFGGVVYPSRSSGKYVKWEWSLVGQRAANLLSKLMPYLKIKRKQAVLATEFQDTRVAPQREGLPRAGNKLTADTLALREGYRLALQESRQEGRTVI